MACAGAACRAERACIRTLGDGRVRRRPRPPAVAAAAAAALAQNKLRGGMASCTTPCACVACSMSAAALRWWAGLTVQHQSFAFARIAVVGLDPACAYARMLTDLAALFVLQTLWFASSVLCLLCDRGACAPPCVSSHHFFPVHACCVCIRRMHVAPVAAAEHSRRGQAPSSPVRLGVTHGWRQARCSQQLHRPCHPCT